jgi:hypothetical protein
MEVFKADLWVIGFALDIAIDLRETLQMHGVKMVAVFRDSQAAIGWTANLEPVTGQWLARWVNRMARSHLVHGINTEIHWVVRHSCIPGNEQADRQSNLDWEASGNAVIERPSTSASNRARRTSQQRLAAKAEWEADKCTKHFSYRQKCKAGTKRPIPMTSAISLAARF